MRPRTTAQACSRVPVRIRYLYPAYGVPCLLLGVLVACTISRSVRAQPQDGGFRASVVKVDITPEDSVWLQGYSPRQSTGVHDRIFHRVVALDDGDDRFVLISTEVAAVSPAFYDRVCEEVEEAVGIDRRNVWWTVTHTHSAPTLGPGGLAKLMLPERYEERPYPNPEYSEETLRILVDAVVRALDGLEPARLGFGGGRARANINRRAEAPDGTISLGMNPDRPVDRRFDLLRLERTDGSPIALVAAYALHGTVLGSENRRISGDAPGVVADYVEDRIGAPMLFVNGAAGNVAPIYSVRRDFDDAHITEFNLLLGTPILDANEQIGSTTSQVDLRTGEIVLETPRKEGYGWISELDRYSRTTSFGAQVVRVPIRFLRVNEDAVVWSAPVELFSQIATEIRQRSPFARTIYFGYTNGFLGYLPVRTAFEEGGYEVGGVSPFTPQVQADVTNAVLNHLDGIYGSN